MKLKLLLGIATSLALVCGGVSAFAAPQKNVQSTRFSSESTQLSSIIVRQNGNSIEQSYDNGVTWENYTCKQANEFFTYDEYFEWVETEKKAIQKLADAEAWTQDQANETISRYNEILKKIKNGLMVSKRDDYNEDQVLFSLPPEVMKTEDYQTVVYDGDTFKSFGPFETTEELYSALKQYSDGQVASGAMMQADADDLLKKYE